MLYQNSKSQTPNPKKPPSSNLQKNRGDDAHRLRLGIWVFFRAWVLGFGVFLLSGLLSPCAHATSPHLTSLLPTGGQLGTELEIKFTGERLQDTGEVISYEPGIEVSKLGTVTNQTV